MSNIQQLAALDLCTPHLEPALECLCLQLGMTCQRLLKEVQDEMQKISFVIWVHPPDIVVVLDASLLEIVNVAAGLKSNGIVVTTSKDAPEKVKEGWKVKNRVGVVDAGKIALEVLGLPITNTTRLGSVVKASGLIKKESMIPPFKERFGRIAEKNIAAFERAYQQTTLD